MIESKWLIHTGCSVGGSAPSSDRRSRATSSVGAPVLAPTGPGDLAAELQRDELGAVADAEHGHAELVHAGSIDGRALDVHRRRARR